jgi:hypothetical protein
MYPPQSLPAITGSTPTTPGHHAGHHTQQRTAINSIADMLGFGPQGDSATVEERVSILESRVTALGV